MTKASRSCPVADAHLSIAPLAGSQYHGTALRDGAGRAHMAHAHDFAETVILITDDGMGRAEPALRHKLIRAYLQLLLESPTLPGVLCFYSDGVKLATEGSPVLDLLSQLENRGVILLSCATCLNYYGLSERLAVGVIGGMHEIVAAQAEAAKVITL